MENKNKNIKLTIFNSDIYDMVLLTIFWENVELLLYKNIFKTLNITRE